jgi:hypothetical protein
MGGTCSTRPGDKIEFRIVFGKPGGKRLLGRPGCRWKVNIKMDFKEYDIKL